MDWNWFFSSVAQSAAAIVGIFAAFIITKIIGNQAVFHVKCNTIDERIADSKALEDEADTRYFKWYNERKMDIEFDKIEEEFVTKGTIHTPDEYYAKYDFSEFIPKSEVLAAIEVKCREYQETKEAERQEIDAKLKRLGPGMAIARPVPMHVRSTLSFLENVNEEREIIDALIVRIRHHCRHIENFLTVNKTHPESSTLITISLILTLVLFYSGVIYPLSFLPLKIDSNLQIQLSAFWDILFSIKGAILLVVSLIFNIIIIVFFIINLRLKYPQIKLQELVKYSSISAYSPYLKTMEDNEIECVDESKEEMAAAS